LVLDQSPFYAQAGGQVWDTGLLTFSGGEGEEEVSVSVTNVQCYGGFVVHVGTVETGCVKEGMAVKCLVDYTRRQLVVPNHTVTHVLNFALRQVLMGGPNPEEEKAGKMNQKGSDVNAERLRFDFSWDEPLTGVQLSEVEALVNEQIAKDYQVYDRVTSLEDAQQIFGLRAVFGEAYPDPVRVVSVGVDVELLLAEPGNQDWANYSVEFCGGTHLGSLGSAEQFVIVDETSTSAGVRRVTGVTRTAAAHALAAGKALLSQVASVEATEDMAAKAAGTKQLKQSFGALGGQVAQVAKYEALERTAVLEKQVAEHNKKLLKQVEEFAVAEVKGWAAAELTDKPGSVACFRCDFGDSGKLNSSLMKVLAKACKGGSFLLVSLDAVGGKVCVYASCDKASEVDALKWCAAAVQGAVAKEGKDESKVGGRDKNAMGSVPGGGAEAAAVLAAAQEFVKA